MTTIPSAKGATLVCYNARLRRQRNNILKNVIQRANLCKKSLVSLVANEAGRFLSGSVWAEAISTSRPAGVKLQLGRHDPWNITRPQAAQMPELDFFQIHQVFFQ